MLAAETKEVTLSVGQYLVTIGKLNTANAAYTSAYLVTMHSAASSVVTLVSSSAASVSVSALKLTITTTSTYMLASITRLCNATNT